MSGTSHFFHTWGHEMKTATVNNAMVKSCPICHGKGHVLTKNKEKATCRRCIGTGKWMITK